jgi:hypothetical protein
LISTITPVVGIKYLVSSCHQIVHKKLFKNKMTSNGIIGINL